MPKFLIVLLVGLVGCSDDSPAVGGSNNTTNNTSNNASNNTTNTSNNASNNTSNNASNNTTNNTTNNDMDAGTDMPALESPCPADSPQGDETCGHDGLVCEYGDDPREACRVIATCTGTNWQVILPRCTAIPDAVCPATRTEAQGEACDAQDAWCTYDDGLNCECTNCSDGPVGGCMGEPTWHCDAPNPDDTCPISKPALGSICSEDSQICNYGCGPNNGRICVQSADAASVWQSSGGGPCPISTRTAKTDIEYLTPAQVGSLANQVRSLKIASWRYTDVALEPTKTRFGIIIEDALGSPAVDSRAKMVDLYGLSSLLLADAQAKDREIQELRTRLEALEQHIKKNP